MYILLTFCRLGSTVGCRLLRLPLELRQQIWSYCVPYHSKIEPIQVGRSHLHYIKIRPSQDNLVVKSINAISLTCRQARNEVSESGLLYKENKFVFSSPIAMLNYLVAITPERRKYIRDISVLSLSHEISYNMFIILSTCTSLRRLNVLTHRVGAEELSKPLQDALNGLEYFDIRLIYPGIV